VLLVFYAIKKRPPSVADFCHAPCAMHDVSALSSQLAAGPSEPRSQKQDSCQEARRGRQKKKSVTPVVGGQARGQKDQGWIYFFDIFFMAFLTSPHRETPKNVITKSKKTVLDFCQFFCKNSST
jgi:hypothetical protein